MKNPNNRYTTMEVASMLFCKDNQVRAVLMIHKIPWTKCGNTYLWDVEAVDELLAFIQKEVRVTHDR